MTGYKKFILAALVMVLLAVTACSSAMQNKKLSVAINASYPPFELLNEKTGQPEGFSVDLMNAVAARAGLDIEWVNVDFDKLLAGVASCQYDLACSSISITEERKKDMLFSDPINTGGQVIVIRKDNTGILSKEDLNGKNVAAQTASTAAIEAGKISGVKLQTYTSIEDVFQKLMDRQSDAVVADNLVSAYFVSKYPDEIKTVGPVFTQEQDAIAICKKNEYLLPKINAALKELKEDGTLDTLKSKWINIK